MNIKYVLPTLINNIKRQKTYTIFPYTQKTYVILLLLKQYCIKSIYKIDRWILIYFLYKKKNLNFKFFIRSDKRNILTYLQLQQLIKKHKHGLIFTSKGIYSLKDALMLKQGGILFCLIYYSN